MNTQSNVFDASALKTAEKAYRSELCRKPDDMDTRANLAWCLLLQALYQSGQETRVSAYRRSSEEVEGAEALAGACAERDARTLLQESLRHSFMVRHLSTYRPAQMAMEKLASLVELAGGAEQLVEAEQQAARIRDNICAVCRQLSETADPLCDAFEDL